MDKESILKLIEAIKEGNIAYILNLANSDWLTTPLDDRKKLAIHFAARYGQLELLQLFLNRKPDLLNVTDTGGQTPILWAHPWVILMWSSI